MSINPFDLSGKTAVITGAATGIGFGIATRFLQSGARVLVVGHTQPSADSAAEKLRPLGAVAAVGADVSAEDAWEMMAGRCVGEFGALDIWVNNAAISPFYYLESATPRLMDKIYQVDLKGLTFCALAAAKVMIAQGRGGKIINVGSIVANRPVAGQGIYGACKAGVAAITRGLALELAVHGIRVNAIVPGHIDSGRAAFTEAQREEMIRSIPLRRMGLPADIATTAVFLASPASDYITGQEIVVDGGALLM